MRKNTKTIIRLEGAILAIEHSYHPSAHRAKIAASRLADKLVPPSLVTPNTKVTIYLEHDRKCYSRRIGEVKYRWSN